MIGGQILYPFVDADWREIPGKKAQLEQLTRDIPGLYISIYLGGMIVFAGEERALKEAEDQLEPIERFPMRLGNHAAFHTPLQAPVSMQGRAKLPQTLFQQPAIPLIDGRGHIWQPRSSKLNDLWDYTFGDQVTQPYNFTNAITNGLKEFAPDNVIILGPGSTLASAVAQTLIKSNWKAHHSKAHFIDAQTREPYILAMANDGQRRYCAKAN